MASFGAASQTDGQSHLGTVEWVLEHHRAVPKFLNETVFALDSCCAAWPSQPSFVLAVWRGRLTRVRNLGDLVAIEAVPKLLSGDIRRHRDPSQPLTNETQLSS